VLLACAACGSAVPPPVPAPSSAVARAGPPVPAVEGIAAEAVENRTDRAAGGQLQVKVSDTGEEPFSVTSVAIDSPGFEPLSAVPVTAVLVPGRRVDLPTPHGEPVCDTAAEPAAARLTVVRPGGAVEEVRVPMDAGALTGIHERLCAVETVTGLVRVTVVDLTPSAQAVTGRLVVTPVGPPGAVVTVVRVEGNVLYDADADLPLEVDGEVSTALTFTTARCDPHARAETKQPYLIPLVATVGDGPEVVLDLPLDDVQRDLLRQLTDRTCVPA
jgi:hypothetical protein